MPTLDLSRINYFVAVVEAGSFSAAAQKLEVNKSVVSHQIAKLERELNTSLLIRTTRKMRLTEPGKKFHERSLKILAEADAAIAELNDQIEQPTGRLTVTAPQDFGTSQVTGAVAAFKKRYPDVDVNLIYDDRTLDLIDDQIDIAVHVGWLQDSSAKARRIGSFEQLLVCSTDFVSVNRIRKPSDLKSVPWISNGALKSPLRWTFSNAKVTAKVIANAAVTTSSTQSAYVCALAGIGATVLPDFLVQDDIADGRLIQLLPKWTLRQGGIYLVLPPSRHRPAKVSAFVDELIAHIKF